MAKRIFKVRQALLAIVHFCCWPSRNRLQQLCVFSRAGLDQKIGQGPGLCIAINDVLFKSFITLYERRERLGLPAVVNKVLKIVQPHEIELRPRSLR